MVDCAKSYEEALAKLTGGAQTGRSAGSYDLTAHCPA